MIALKTGGLILTGLTAYLIANKAINMINNSVNKACEASKWRNYYKCWSNGHCNAEPIAPGYSVTTRPANSDYEVVNNPNENKSNSDPNMDVADAIVKACTDAVKDIGDSLIKPVNTQEEASEGQGEASEDNIVYMDEKGKENEDETVD